MTLVSAAGQSTSQSQSALQPPPVAVTASATAPVQVQSVSPVPANIAAYLQQQDTLSQQERALKAQGATQAQLLAWRQQNASLFAAQQQFAEAMGTTAALQLRPTNTQPNIPAAASQTLSDFLTTQAALGNAHAQIHNQIVQQAAASGQSLTLAQISQMEQQQEQLFQQQHDSDLQLQVQRAQTLASVSAQAALPVPGSSVVPPNASPQLAAFLTARDQLAHDEIQFRNQYVTATAAVRDAAIQQWHQQNLARFQQLQHLAQSLASVNSAQN